MERTFPLPLIVSFPLVAGLLAVWLAPSLRRALGEPRARAVLHYAGLFGLAMAALFLAQILDQALLPLQGSFVTWQAPSLLVEDRARLELRLVLDPISVAAALGLVVLPLASALRGSRDPRGPEPRTGGSLLVLVAVALALVMARSLSVLVAATLLLGPAAAGALRRATAARGRQVEDGGAARDAMIASPFVGVLLATLALLPAPDLDLLRVTAAAGERSLLRTNALLGVPMAEALGLGLVLLTAGRMGLPPFTSRRAAAFERAPVPAAVIHAVVLDLGAVYLLLRLNSVFALAPWSMAALTILGLAGALTSSLRARGADDEGTRLASLSALHAAMACVAAGMGAWWVALLLTLGSGAVVLAAAHLVEEVAVGARDLRVETMRGRGRSLPWLRPLGLACALGLAGALPFASAVGLAEAMLAATSRLSALSLGINVAGAGVCLLAVAFGAAGAVEGWRVLFRAEGPTGPQDDGSRDAAVAIGACLLVAAGIAALAIPGVGGPRGWWPWWISGLTATSESYGGELALGTIAALGRDGEVLPAIRAATHVAVLGLALAPLSRPGWLGAGSPSARSLARALDRGRTRLTGTVELAGAGLAHLVADGGDGVALGEVVDQAGAASDAAAWGIGRGLGGTARRERLALALGLLLVLGWVYTKPSIATPGPTRYYGFGGLRPALQRAADPSRRRPARSLEEASPEIDERSGTVTLPEPDTQSVIEGSQPEGAE